MRERNGPLRAVSFVWFRDDEQPGPFLSWRPVFPLDKSSLRYGVYRSDDTLLCVGVLYTYFVARSADAAAAVLDQPGGPGGPDATELVDGVMPVPLAGIDPAVMLGQLESLLTGVSWEAIFERDGTYEVVAATDDDAVMVMSLPAAFQRALAGASKDALDAVSEPWSQIEEFGGDVDPRDLEDIVFDLAALARRAESTQRRIYCWICL